MLTLLNKLLSFCSFFNPFFLVIGSFCNFLLCIVTCSLLILNASCVPSYKKVASQPVVRVNNDSLVAKDFSDQLARKLKNYDALGAKDPNNIRRAKEEIVKSFILASLLNEFAKTENISVSQQELDKEIQSYRSSYPDDISFRRVLAEENISFSDWKKNLKQTLLEKKVFTRIGLKLKDSTDEEGLKYYEDNKPYFKRKDRIYLRQIVLDDYSKAQSIKGELKQKNFAELAIKYSVAPEGKNGGLVGWIEQGSVDFFDKAFSLNIGTISPILESAYGFHIFLVEKKLPAGFLDYKEVKSLVSHILRSQKEQAEFTAWLDKQIRASQVLKDNAFIEAFKVETKGLQK